MTRGRVAALIDEARERHGLSYRDIERESGIARQSIADYVNGNFKQLPTRDRIAAIAAAIRVPMATMLHAFMQDLDMDLLDMRPQVDLWEALRRTTTLTKEQRELIERQLLMFQRNGDNRHAE